ncbi:MAG: hypothetical protein NDI61_01690 [Bdellovibrionaceae bacterium]|nr:hypothetical protein [Pseudobdellovibrionaceae bacterium]
MLGQEMERFRLFIIFASFSVHLFLGWCLTLIQVEPVIPKNAIDHYIEFVETPKPYDDKSRSFARQPDVPQEMLTKNDRAKRRFASEREQTVLEETRAAESGLTKNRSTQATGPKPRLGALAPRSSARTAQKPPPLASSIQTFEHGLEGGRGSASTDNSFDDDPNSKPLTFPSMARFGLEAGRSTFGEMAPRDLKIGQMTALNTDRFLYYSFYERAQELVYHHWAKYVRAVLYSYQRSGRATGDEFWVTRVEIVLDREGHFLKGLLHQGSGLQSLDLAPVHAFREAKQIPHPPPEMIKDDGTIRMDWEFAVQMIPTYASGR